jgi:hypothetical protein
VNRKATAPRSLPPERSRRPRDLIIDPNPGGSKFFIDVANKNVQLLGERRQQQRDRSDRERHHHGKRGCRGRILQHQADDNTTILSQLVFTLVDPNLLSDFFRGQLDDPGNVTISVTDNQGNAAQDFVFPIANAKSGLRAYWHRLAPRGDDQERSISNPSFKEVKQIELSGQGVPVSTPEPATLALAGAGLVGLGLARRRRRAV